MAGTRNKKKQLSNIDVWEFPKMGGPQYSTLNRRILIIRTPKLCNLRTAKQAPFLYLEPYKNPAQT